MPFWSSEGFVAAGGKVASVNATCDSFGAMERRKKDMKIAEGRGDIHGSRARMTGDGAPPLAWIGVPFLRSLPPTELRRAVRSSRGPKVSDPA
jgi:hypothetical protein